MLKNRIIPCLDVKNGRVVKGINFVELKDAGDPVEQAKIYSEGGADEICFLDITASNENRDTILDVVKKTSQECFVPLTVGGGVRNITDISNLLKSFFKYPFKSIPFVFCFERITASPSFETILCAKSLSVIETKGLS